MIALFAVFCRIATAGEGQPSAQLHPSAIVADLGLHVIGLGYQRTVTDHVSTQGTVSLYVPWTASQELLSGGGGKGDAAGFVVRGRAFYHPLGKAPCGLWLSPFAQAGFASGTRAGVKAYGPAIAAGASVGYTAPIGKHLMLMFGGGGQWHVVTIPGGGGSPSLAGFWPQIDLNVDWAF